MQIIAGTLRSRRLKTVEGEGYRPAMSRVRESLFSMLDARIPSWDGMQVLDLFAGSGSLAFEAISRGADKAWLVELSNAAVRCLGDNIHSLALENRCFVVREDCLKMLRRVHGTGRGVGGPFGLVFADPPYRKHLAQGSLDALAECGWLAPSAFVVMEIEKDLSLTVPDTLDVVADRLFGQTRILVMQAPAATL